MAEAEASVLVRRTSMLLRCQAAREAGARRGLGRALRAQAEAEGALVRARQTLAEHEASRRTDIDRRYEALEGRCVDPSTLQALPAIEASWREEAARLSAALRSAVAKLDDAAATERVERRRLSDAARATCRRERLADMAAASLRRARAVTDDTERDDAASEAWRDAPEATG